MGKIDKFKNSVKQGKRFLIIISVLWLILAIVLVAPIALAWAEAPNGSNSDFLTNFVEYFVKEVTSFTAFFRMFGYKGAFGIFLKCYCFGKSQITLENTKKKWIFFKI